ncbi:Pyruvate/Phosphoenolpyruvate kinase-like domain-containing protein [Mucidula mucida]|nr:Pyruvate/Phosphoenolpyruvate kinase-like domain-containing protein [Mucidula mucida]
MLHSSDSVLRRSYLYVPCSNPRMLEKSTSVDSDVIVYDLEDSVAPKDKEQARNNLIHFLGTGRAPDPSRVAVRINDNTTTVFETDLHDLSKVSGHFTGIVLPKVHAVDYLDHVASVVANYPSVISPLRLISSVESALALMNISNIASWKAHQSCVLGALLAGEDCADTSIIRSRSRTELLFARSQIVNAAKAHRMEAIDMVCVNYKDHDYLKDECQDGRRLGFTGKQAIHPAQVSTIQSTFVPTSAEILRAAKIVYGMEQAHRSQKGAIGLDGEMIDAPMIKQAERIIHIAQAAGLEIPLIAS